MVVILTQFYQINNKSWFLYWYFKFWLNFRPKFRKILLSRWSIKDFLANLNLTKGLSPSDVLLWQQCSLRKILNDLAKVNFKTWQELSNASPFLLRWKFGKSWKKNNQSYFFLHSPRKESKYLSIIAQSSKSIFYARIPKFLQRRKKKLLIY